ncbi:MAG: hypothetical protein AAB533_03355 [Patescibacteria group bacterium]
MFISSRRLDRQLEEEVKKNARLNRITLLEAQIFWLIIEEGGTMDLYDSEVQNLLCHLIAAQKRYMKMYGVDWTVSIAKKEALLREV